MPPVPGCAHSAPDQQAGPVQRQLPGAEPTEYTLRTASESHRTDVLGYDLAEYNLTFVAQLPFGRELKPNLDAADFFAALSAWIRGQERTHNYPAVSGYRVTKITASNAGVPTGADATRPAINYKSNSILRRNNHGRSCYQPDRRPKS